MVGAEDLVETVQRRDHFTAACHARLMTLVGRLGKILGRAAEAEPESRHRHQRVAGAVREPRRRH